MIENIKIEQETYDLAKTPEGKLLIAVLVRALEDLDYEIKKGKPMYMLNWFFSNNEVFDLACYVLGWNKDIFRKRLIERIKTGVLIPIEKPSARTLKKRAKELAKKDIVIKESSNKEQYKSKYKFNQRPVITKKGNK
jgi:hypothetical protein